MDLGPAGGISAKRQYAGQIIQAGHFVGPKLESILRSMPTKTSMKEGSRRLKGAGKQPDMSPSEHEVLNHQIKVSRA
eukprot:5790066-Pyramimonas_sp.AAC.1